jgi:hypothetical protein
MVWYDTFDSVFFLGVLGAVIGLCGVGMKYCTKAKCRQCSVCFGAVNVERDTQAEMVEDLRLIDSRVAGQSSRGLANHSDSFTLTPTPSASPPSPLPLRVQNSV